MLQFIFSPLAILSRFLVLKMESIAIQFNGIFYFGCVFSARPAISLLGVLRIGWWLKISTSPPFFLAHNYPSFSEGQSPSVITCLCLSHLPHFRSFHKRLSKKGKWVWYPTVGDVGIKCFCSGFFFLRLRWCDSETETELMREYPGQSNPEGDFWWR